MNKIHAPRLMVAATGSGKGKTTLTTSLLYLLKKQCSDIHSFKCGPDYIDPMYHESVLGIESGNLDPFFCNGELLKASFADGHGRLNIIEGCMGLFDGLGVTSECSPYSVASTLDCPIILVVDAHGKGYSILAEIQGFLNYDINKLIKGVFLNQVSDAYFEKLKSAIEKELNISVVGHLPRLSGEELESRHLGLKSVKENEAVSKIQRTVEALQERIDLKNILELAEETTDIHVDRELADFADDFWRKLSIDLKDKRVAIAKDDAFSFYYRDNIRSIELAGGKVVYFSPLEDDKLPLNIDFVYLGGGYPELYADRLSNNNTMRQSIKEYIDAGGMTFAECGGFMYLNKSIEDKPMVGIFSSNAENKKRLVRFGYVTISMPASMLVSHAMIAQTTDKEYFITLKGHEFHHYDVDNPGDVCQIMKASTGDTYKAFAKYKNCLAGFPHVYFL